MRYAFLTTEFLTTMHGAGGLATYTRRMATLLADLGHEVEIFVLNNVRDDTVNMFGCTIRHVRYQQSQFDDFKLRVFHRIHGSGSSFSRMLRRRSAFLCSAVEKSHSKKPFDVVQSPDYLAPGLTLSKRPNRIHIVRSSGAIDLIMACDGRTDPAAIAQIVAEREVISHADIAIAPSKYVAEHYEHITGRKVHVVRPPAYLEEEPAPKPTWLPRRFLIHFAGFLGTKKGTDLIVKALPIAIEQEPDLVMLWVGILPEYLKNTSLSRNVSKIHPLDKNDLYAVIQHAVASVLPSQVDNIPNTVLESLLLETPLILTRGASLDEIVDDGPGVMFVELDDHVALANAMVAAWRGELTRTATPWIKTHKSLPFTPDLAISSHIELLREHGVCC